VPLLLALLLLLLDPVMPLLEPPPDALLNM
jgi:hypothetical protein